MPTLLDQLRDIHLPDPAGWWPPAYGYWLLLVMLLVVLYLWYRRYKRFAVHRAARRELHALTTAYASHNDSHELARSINVLLRRTLLSLEPRHEVAGLTGDEWIRRVHDSVASSGFEFSDRAKALLVEGIYRPSVDVDADALIAECRGWIGALPPGRAT